MILNELQTAQVEALFKKYGRTDLSRSEINDMVKSGEISNPSWYKKFAFRGDPIFHTNRFTYIFPLSAKTVHFMW